MHFTGRECWLPIQHFMKGGRGWRYNIETSPDIRRRPRLRTGLTQHTFHLPFRSGCHQYDDNLEPRVNDLSNIFYFLNVISKRKRSTNIYDIPSLILWSKCIALKYTGCPKKNALLWFLGYISTLERARNNSRGCLKKFRKFSIR